MKNNMGEYNNTSWTNEERLNHLKLQLCRKFGVLESDIYLEYAHHYQIYRLSFRVGRDKYEYNHADIEVFINEIQNALLKDQMRDDKLNILFK